jgi:hypothetical protein
LAELPLDAVGQRAEVLEDDATGLRLGQDGFRGRKVTTTLIRPDQGLFFTNRLGKVRRSS